MKRGAPKQPLFTTSADTHLEPQPFWWLIVNTCCPGWGNIAALGGRLGPSMPSRPASATKVLRLPFADWD